MPSFVRNPPRPAPDLVLVGDWSETPHLRQLSQGRCLVVANLPGAAGRQGRPAAPDDGRAAAQPQDHFADAGPVLVVAAVCDDFVARGLMAGLRDVPWIAWFRAAGHHHTEACLRAGALVILPAETATDDLLAAVEALRPPLAQVSTPVHRHCRAGRAVHVPSDAVGVVDAGVVAAMSTSPSGDCTLLGLLGPRRLLLPDPQVALPVEYLAHTDVALTIAAREDLLGQRWFAEALQAEVLRGRRWNAAQSLPRVEDRLLQTLEILGEDFGRVSGPHHSVVDVRVTHTQLAMAAGANRSTVTRAVTRLRSRQRLTSVGAGAEQRFCLHRTAP